MLDAVNTWSDYRSKVREFDAVLEYGKAVSQSLVGAAVPSRHAGHGAQIFVKLLSHGAALRRLAPDPNRREAADAWDVPSLSALARCVVEAHDAFEYVAGHDVGEAERRFRLRLWELHDQTRRLRMLDGIGSQDARLEEMRSAVARLQADVAADAFLATLPAELQAELRRRLARGDPPAFHLGQRQRCALSRVDARWHDAVTMQLSQYAHTLPFELHQLSRLEPGTPEGLRLMALPLLHALPFLARTTEAVVTLLPGRAPQPPSRTARTMAAWRTLAERGLQA